MKQNIYTAITTRLFNLVLASLVLFFIFGSVLAVRGHTPKSSAQFIFMSGMSIAGLLAATLPASQNPVASERLIAAQQTGARSVCYG